jgi:leucyl aminopeptidase
MLSCLAADDAATLPLHLATPDSLAGLVAGLPDATGAFLAGAGFTAKAGQVALLPGPAGVAGAVLGLGAAAPTPFAFGALAQSLPEGSAWHLAAADAATGAMATLGWCLGAYRYTRFKPPARKPALLRAPPGAEAAIATAAVAWRVRDLINTPANLLGPAELAAAVAALAAPYGATCEIITGPALEEGFPALHAVGAAASPARAPRVARLEWRGPGATDDSPLLALCGKGVCFDTGGLDLKPSAGMLRMKKDMGGAAIMTGVAELVMQAGLPIRLLLLVGAVENAVAAESFRPGDVLRTRAGLRVEVGNTDAEGRLVLADLLACAAERQPALLLDAATLTGAARVALGPDLPALFTPDDGLAQAILAAGEAGQDPLWRLPLQNSYTSWLDSSVADLNNVAAKPMAGAIIGALFLQRFVPAGLPWAHLDVYAWNDSDRPGRPEGGEAQGMRALAAAIGQVFAAGRGGD